MEDDWPPLDDFAWGFQGMEEQMNPDWALSHQGLTGAAHAILQEDPHVTRPISATFQTSLPGRYVIPSHLSTAVQCHASPYDTNLFEQTPPGFLAPAIASYGDLSIVSVLNNEQPYSLVGASTSTTGLRRELKKFHCLVSGCERAYVNKRDLARHSKKHTRALTFDCPAIGCSKIGDDANYLRYKFVEHLRKGHRKPTMWICPVTSCDAQAKDLGLLVEHIRGHDSDIQGDKVVSAICGASKNQEK